MIPLYGNATRNELEENRTEWPELNLNVPSTVACIAGFLCVRKLAAPYPTADIINRPGYWNRTPPNKPPDIPCLTAPNANETCVDVGPGRQEERAKSSIKAVSLIHLSF
jgi:hypothetical protein